MSKATVIHHSADYDGIFCREIARKFLPDAELIGWDYGDAKIPLSILESPQDRVYVLDLSPDCIDGIGGATDQLVWIDHHKSAIDKFPTTIPGYRIDGVAACRLAWQWFNLVGQVPNPEDFGLPSKEQFVKREVSEPFAVRLAGEYDIWDKRDERAELFQHGLRSQELTQSVWDELLDPQASIGFAHRVQVLLTQGRALQYAKQKENEDIITHYGFTIQFEGLTFLACNHARYNSFLFTAGLKPEHDACLGFKWDGSKWSVSLYHAPGKEHHDLSQIAVKHGGGGHKGACGFTAKSLQFLT